MTGEFPGSRRQGCVVALGRGSDTVPGSLRDKSKCQREATPPFAKHVPSGSGFAENGMERDSSQKARVVCVEITHGSAGWTRGLEEPRYNWGALREGL